MTFKPGGMGKSGAYNGFYGCPKWPDCKESVNIPEKLGRLMTMEHQFVRDKGIAWFNSTNGAIEMVNGKPPKAEWNAEFYQEQLRFWRDWFMSEWKAFYMEEIILEKDKVVEELKSKLEKE